MLSHFLYFAVISVVICCSTGNVCNIEDYGAKGNNRTVNTRHIQQAINDNSCNGIFIPAGIFKTGKLHLKSHFSVEIDPNGVLLGSPFHVRRGPLIKAENCNDLSFFGGGSIDSGGDHDNVYKVIELIDSNNIQLFNFSVYQTAHDWCFLCENCSNVEMDHFQLHGFDGRDGLDLVGCKNVSIHHSLLLGSDDALALKANTTIDSRRGQAYNSFNISVWNCELASKDDNAMQFGSETPGNFSDIHFSNIKVSSAGKAGIGITSNDGGYIHNVQYNNIIMNNVATPFWIKLTNRTLPVGKIYDISISNIKVSNVYGYTSENNFTSALDGFDEKNLLGPNIIFNNISIEYLGGASLCAVDINPPNPDIDYRPRYLGPRPSYGFYVRHAQGIQFNNVSVSFETTDLRPAVFIENSSEIHLVDFFAERASGTLSDCDVIIENSGDVTVNKESNLTTCAYKNIPDCPHPVYYYSPYDY